MSASRGLRATFPHDSAVSREPGSIRMSSGPFSPGGVVRGSGSTCWRGWAGAGWCGWGSWDDPGRGRVRICCKGAPGRDRRREEARNINVSLPAFRRDRGLCNRFGQTAPSRAPARTAVPAIAPALGPTRPGRRNVHFALERALLTAHLDVRRTDPPAPTRTAPARTAPHRPRPAPPRTGPGPRTTAPGEKGSIRLRGLVRTRSRSRVVSHADPSGPVGGADPGPARDRSCPAAKEGRP